MKMSDKDKKIEKLEWDIQLLNENMRLLVCKYNLLENSDFKIHSIIKKGMEHDEMLLILRSYSTPAGVVVEVS